MHEYKAHPDVSLPAHQEDSSGGFDTTATNPAVGSTPDMPASAAAADIGPEMRAGAYKMKLNHLYRNGIRQHLGPAIV
jgi:hypothetical protein